MRSFADRLRHTISFEIIGLAIVTPLGAWLFGLPMADMGIVGVGSAGIAATWNYLYNLGFDHVLQRLHGTTRKSWAVRALHAVLFEVGLTAMLMPLIAWYLQTSLMQALVMDIALAVFYMVYAFVFNWAYDQLFPLPEWRKPAASEI